jgi:VWFA-related protein
MRRSALVLLTVAVLATPVPIVRAQRAQPPPVSTFRGRTDLIIVDVSVLDHDRVPVSGLAAADFTVLEDGKRRPVVAFSAVNVPGPARNEAAAPWIRDAPRDVVSNEVPDEGRLVVILIDGSIPDGQSTVMARQIARAAIDELGPGDLAAVVRSSVFGNNGLPQGFTADRARLIEAIDSPFTGTTEPPGMTPLGLESPSPVPAGFDTKNQCEVIFDIARAMRDVPRRRKVLLFVGSAIGVGGVLRSGGEIRPCRDQMMRELDMANVTVQAIDPVGLLTTAVTADYTTHLRMTANVQQGWARQNQSRVDNLRVLPDHTGGRLVANTNTPEDHLAAIFAESQSYYLLGFEPAAPSAGDAFHPIRVQVRRRGVTVHSRSGYLAQPRATLASASATNATSREAGGAAPGPEVAAALDGALPRQDLPLSVAVAPFGLPTGRNAAVAVTLGATLPAGATAGLGPRRLGVTVGAFDSRGRSVGVASQTVEVPAELARPGRADEGLLTRLDLPPGRYELRAAATDEASGTIGSVFSFVDVPDFSRDALAASGLLLHHDHPPYVEDNPLADVVSIVPTVARAWPRSDTVRAFLRVYQPQGREWVVVTMRVIDAMNATVFERRIDLGADAFPAGTADVDVPLPLSQLVPGHYLLTMIASRGELRAVRAARFEVVVSKPES